MMVLFCKCLDVWVCVGNQLVSSTGQLTVPEAKYLTGIILHRKIYTWMTLHSDVYCTLQVKHLELQ